MMEGIEFGSGNAECGIKDIRQRVLNAEVGMRNAELKIKDGGC